MEEKTERKPINDTLLAMKPGDTERWPIQRFASVQTSVNILKTKGLGEWTTSRRTAEGYIEATRVS